MSAALRLETLGALRLSGPNGELLPRHRKELALLVYLVAHAPHAVRRDELQALLWGERDETKARNSLRHALLTLRRTLGDAIVVGDRDVRVPGDTIGLDARDFEARARGGDHSEALGLWAGEFVPDGETFGGETFRVWLEIERARLVNLRNGCFEHVVAGHESAGSWHAMARAAERWAKCCPLEERPHIRLIEALRLDGRIGDALAEEAAFAHRVRTELESEPSLDWQRAMSRLRRDSLAAPMPDVAGRATNETRGTAPRDAVFTRLLSAWRAVTHGDARRVVVEGAGGQHATLAREFVRWMQHTQRGALVLHAPSTSDSSSNAPDQRGHGGTPGNRLARLLAPLGTARGLAGASAEDLATLSRYVPAVCDRFAALPAAPNDGNVHDGNIAAALRRVLAVVAEERPIGVVIEDVGALDDATRTLVLDLARTLHGAVLLVLAMDVAEGNRLAPALRSDEGTSGPIHLRIEPTARGTARRRPTRSLAFTVAAIVLSVAAWAPWAVRWLDPRAPLVAVGRIDMVGVPDSLRALPALLTTDLARVQQISVVSDSRMQEIMARLAAGRSNAPTDMQRAAQIAGASEIVEGMLSRRSTGTLRLDVRRVDLKSGSTRGAFTVEGNDAFDVVDLATERLAKELGGAAPSSRFATTTRSLVAYRFYEEGLRTLYEGDWMASRKLFLSALGEDSTFAMAAFYAARLSPAGELWALMQRAVRMAAHATDRERLLIMSNYASAMSDPARLAYAESLATRYPAEPDGHFEYAQALVVAGRFLDAVPQYRLAIAMDSLGLLRITPRCIACEAYSGLMATYRFADSLAAAERAARELVRRQPRLPGAWALLSSALATDGRYDEALGALRTYAALAGLPRVPMPVVTDIWLRQDKFDSVDKAWQQALATGTRDEQADALEAATNSLRLQGRLYEALATASRLRALKAGSPSSPASAVRDAFPEATVLFELGRYRESGLLFDSIAAIRDGPSAGRIGRGVAWMLSHSATAFAAAGDTARLRVLEDTVRVFGARSEYARDQRLYHYVHGLRLRAQGKLAAAADAFRRSEYSPVEGNTRACLELGRTLLELARPLETIPVQRSALAGPIGASGQYANRTELHELLGRAYDRAGKPDSAMMQYRSVLTAWRHADATFAARRAEIEERVRVLSDLR